MTQTAAVSRPSAAARSAERLTAELDGDFVVFLIGMQINRPWKVGSWLPVAMAMPRMLRELAQQPELGCLASWGSGLSVIQYWRSAEQLQAYAHAQSQQHLPAWREFNRRARTAAGDVGIWHETFRVRAGEYETIYVGTAPRGLGQAGRLLPASGRRSSAAGRLQGAATSASENPAPASL
ncbi:DUF4188 domain-containing protein [Deinococcus sonorensis]|uniref:DUF4188 domain-containing protein n=2 Tax=Deinococcus sonorensis TaxID=309891 RepID=A0AAU7UEB4_9DEIO